MALCSACGMETLGSGDHCAHHLWREAGWAANNRALCDLLHRGVAPARLSLADRAEEFIVFSDVSGG